MPTVPQSQRTVQIDTGPTVRSTTNYSPEAFGAGVGRAIAGAGMRVTDLAQAELQKQNTAKLMSAERSLQDWQNKALFTPETGAYSQKGSNAFGLPDKLLPEWDAQVSAAEAAMSDDQRHVFRQRAGNMRTQMERDLMRHVGGEAESFQKQETTALAGTRVESALLNWNNPTRVDDEIREAQGVILAGNPGIPPAALRQSLTDIESKVRYGVAMKMLDDDPLGAQKYADTYAASMNDADRTQLDRVLKPARIDAEAERAISRATGQGAGATSVPSDYATYRRVLESGGDADAKNQNSSATGADQFTSGTWLSVVKKASPAWAAGLSDSQLLALRTDPEKSGEMAAAMDQDNTAALSAAGLPATNVNLYAAHHFGSAGGIKFAKAAGDAPAESLFSSEIVAANPYLKGKTKDEVITNWNARAAKGGSTGSAGEAPSGAPGTPAEVLARLDQEADPEVRKAAMAKYQTKVQIEKLAKDQREQEYTEAINTAIEGADPSLPIRKVLSSEQYAWAAEQGKLPVWEKRLADRLSGTEPTTDPVLFSSLQTVFSRAENGDATALAEVKKMDPTTLYTSMDKTARDYIQSRRLAIVTADSKSKTAGASDKLDFASEDDQLNTEVFGKLGISRNPTKGEDKEAAATRYQFMQSYWAATESKTAELGRKPTSTERQAIMRDLILPFSRQVRDSFLGFDYTSKESKRAFETEQVPGVDRKQIIEAYQRAHNVAPNDAQIRALYMRSKGYTPALETK